MRTNGSFRRTILVLGALTIGTGSLAAACSTTSPSTSPGRGTLAPGHLELQPDVVIVQTTDGSAPSLSADGLTWTFKAGTAGLDALAPGKVVVAGDATGRIRSIETTAGGDTEVALDPAGLGEIIRNGELSSGDAPIPLVDPRVVIAPDLPGTLGPGDADISMGIPGLALAAARSTYPATAVRPPTVPTVTIGGGADVTAFCCDPGVGAHVHYDRNNVRVTALMYYKLDSPTVAYHALFRDGQVVEGNVEIHGLKGIHLDLEAADHELEQNVDETYLIPVEFRVPISGIAVDEATGKPMQGLSIGVMQMWDIQTSFSARTGSLLGTADYDFDSDFLEVAFDQAHGGGVGFAPGRVLINTSLLNTMTGVSVGVARVQLVLTVRWCLCAGALMGESGMFVQLTSSFVAANDSSAVAVLRKTHCRGVHFQLWHRSGLGSYLFPGFADALNKLRAAAGQSPVPDNGGRISKSILRVNSAITDPPGMKQCQ